MESEIIEALGALNAAVGALADRIEALEGGATTKSVTPRWERESSLSQAFNQALTRGGAVTLK